MKFPNISKASSLLKTQQPIRVANIIEDGKIGGPQIRIMAVAASIDESIETTVIMPRQNSKQFQTRCKALSILYCPMFITHITKEWKEALGYILFWPFEVLGLAILFRRKRFDIVHVSGGSWQYKGVIAGKFAGCCVLWHLNDTSMPLLFRKLFSLFSPFADGFIYASERSKKYYQSFASKNKRSFVIPAPVDTIAFNPGLKFSEDECFRQLSIDGKIIIGTVANINPVKGLETLIRSAAQLKEDADRLAFLVIGPVYDNQKKYYLKLNKLCTELCVDNVHFVGGRKDVRPILNRVDIYLCSSNFESSPLSVWEAMAMGKPIVSTNVGDVSMYVKDDVNGFIVDVGDVDSVSDRLTSLINSKALRAKFSRYSRKIVKKYLDLPLCTERHHIAYKSILK